ncbi:MAG TPA: hypothetical protein RMH99_22245 [Sandaracinaceae bacterium LLY-WYZ-13_1]|nr:hypothetical protein [Sandaracinaceae bacterium LLY-WYZ-13_1]
MSEPSPWATVREALERRSPPSEPSDEAALAARARRLARPLRAPGAVHGELLRTHLGGAIVLFPTEAVLRVARGARPVPLPGTPRQLRGLLRLRGVPTAVFDVGPLITGRPTAEGDAGWVVTLAGRGDRPDLTVRARDVLETLPHRTEGWAAPPEDAPPFVRALGAEGELLVDPRTLLADPRLVVDHSDEQ